MPEERDKWRLLYARIRNDHRASLSTSFRPLLVAITPSFLAHYVLLVEDETESVPDIEVMLLCKAPSLSPLLLRR